VKVPYPNAGAYSVLVDGNEIGYTPWDEAIGRHGALTKTKGCGENRFVAIENYLEFYLTAGCEVTVKPRDAIMSSVRMEWTMAEFYADGGIVSFTDRVAAALGIHASTIKVVAVYQGSVIVDFWIEEDDNEDEPQTALQAAGKRLMEAFRNGAINLGAPILDALSNGELLIRGYNPEKDNTDSAKVEKEEFTIDKDFKVDGEVTIVTEYRVKEGDTVITIPVKSTIIGLVVVSALFLGLCMVLIVTCVYYKGKSEKIRAEVATVATKDANPIQP